MPNHEPILIDLKGAKGQPAQGNQGPTAGGPGGLIVVNLRREQGAVIARINEGQEHIWHEGQELRLTVEGGLGRSGRPGSPGRNGVDGRREEPFYIFEELVIHDGEDGTPGEHGENGESASDGGHAGDILVILDSDLYETFVDRIGKNLLLICLTGGQPGVGGKGGSGGTGGMGGITMPGPNPRGFVARNGLNGKDGDAGIPGLHGRPGFPGTASILIRDTGVYLPCHEIRLGPK